MKIPLSTAWRRHAPAARLVSALAWVLGGACAADQAAIPADGSAGTDFNDAAGGTVDGVSDAGADDHPPSDGPRAVDAPNGIEVGGPMTEPALLIPTCGPDAGTGCCASALGFEDYSTMHFLTPACCSLALASPALVTAPTSCGTGALRLNVDFRAFDENMTCGQPAEPATCAHRVGEVSRSVLAPLDLTLLTLSAMIYLDGPPLPPVPAQSRLFVIDEAGVVEGPSVPLPQLSTWTRVELPFPSADAPGSSSTAGRGAGIRLIGVRITFNGQAWQGRMYVDEITWR